MKNKLYVNGCSYTFGIGTEPEVDNLDAPFKHCWGAQLASKLKYDILNDAQPGSCNDRILRSTVKSFITEKPDLAIIMWSDPFRTEMFRPQETEHQKFQSMVQITPQGVGNINSFYHREAMENYFTFIESKERAVLRTLSHMLTIDALSEAMGIPCIQFHYKWNFYKAFMNVMEDRSKEVEGSIAVKNLVKELQERVDLLNKPHIYGIKDGTSFGTLRHEWGDPDSKWSGGHPDREGHLLMADWFYVELKKKNFI